MAHNYEKIAEIQDSFLDENARGTIPLRHIPEFYYDVWREHVDHKSLLEYIKENYIHSQSSPEKLSDGYCHMLETADISLNMGVSYDKRGKWNIFFDDLNQIYWKCAELPDDITLEYYVNYLLND